MGIRFTSYFCVLVTMALHQGVVHARPAQYSNDLPDYPGEAPSVDSVAEAPRSQDWPAYFASHSALRQLKLGVQLKGLKELSKNASLPMLPASTEKLITAAAALKYLGPQFRFENKFHGELNSETLELSKVKFTVSGDPTWANDVYEGDLTKLNSSLQVRMDKVVLALKEKSVKRVVGPVEIESLHPELDQISRPQGWRPSWQLECMAMMQTSFQANGNCGTVVLNSATRVGWLTTGVDIPLQLKLVRSRSGKTSITITPNFDETGRIRAYTFSGVMGRGPQYYDLPVHQGTRWLKNLFIQSLANHGIAYQETQLTGDPAAQAPQPLDVDLSSDSLLNILTIAVQNSLNGIMDRIFYEITFRQSAKAGVILTQVFSDLVADPMLLEGIQIIDGCGLDLRNQMRADALYRFLDRVRGEAYFQDFFSTLPVAGESGTLKTRTTLVGSALTNHKIFAKTGTLTGVNNLAGYFRTPLQTIEPFVVLSESKLASSQVRPLVDGIVVNFAAQNTP